MEIRNEIKQKDEDKKQFVHRSLAEVQRAKLNKLMENPDKPVVIPEFVNKKDKDYNAPSFVRNVMGSSAGAGSGEFHVYRHLRRKENARQKYMKTQCETERLDTEFQQKLDDNERLAEAKTNKKREKRKKKKANARNKGKKPKLEEDKEESEELSNDEEDEDEVEQAEKDPVECVSEQVEKDPVSEQNEEKIEEKPVVVENVSETLEKVENKEEVSTKEDE